MVYICNACAHTKASKLHAAQLNFVESKQIYTNIMQHKKENIALYEYITRKDTFSKQNLVKIRLKNVDQRDKEGGFRAFGVATEI